VHPFVSVFGIAVSNRKNSGQKPAGFFAHETFSLLVVGSIIRSARKGGSPDKGNVC